MMRGVRPLPLAAVASVALALACGSGQRPSPAEPEPSASRSSAPEPAPSGSRSSPPSEALPACQAPDPAATELTHYGDATEGERYYLMVEHDPRYGGWRPVERLEMPLHHASRLEWRNLDDYPRLANATAEQVRFTFELESIDIDNVPRKRQWRATYTARIVRVCA